MNYTEYSVEDFLMDSAFQEWVIHPTPERNAFWENYVLTHPQQADTIQKARLLILSMDFRKTPAHDIPKQRLFERIQSSVARTHRAPSVFRSYYKIAAVFLGIMLSLCVLYFMLTPGYERYNTAFGSMQEVTLPDGSRVTLNANSSLRFKDEWRASEARIVWLEGEAFFDVVRGEQGQKFIVVTDKIDVEVLGTEFNVQTRKNSTKVVLSRGRVKLNGKGGAVSQEVFMDPGELVELVPENNSLVKSKVDPELFLSWRKGELIFRATPLEEIAQLLEDTYGWRAVFRSDSLKHLQFTGTIHVASANDLELLMTAISEAFDIGVSRHDDEVIFQ